MLGSNHFQKVQQIQSRDKKAQQTLTKVWQTEEKNPQNNACFIDKHCKYFVRNKYKYFNKFTVFSPNCSEPTKQDLEDQVYVQESQLISAS